MIDTKTLAKLQLSAHIGPVRERLMAFLAELNVPIELMERASNDYDLCHDKEYQALACLYCALESAAERYDEILTTKDN